MATFELTASPAAPSGSGFSVIMHIDARPDPMPSETFEASNLPEIESRLASYLERAKAKGEPMAVCVRLISGRAPNGFKAWKNASPFYHRVNV